jgi:hypothetical protein
MAHQPLKMSIGEAHAEVDKAWRFSYSPRRNEEMLELLRDRRFDDQLIH